MFCDVHSGVYTHADVARLSDWAVPLCVCVSVLCVLLRRGRIFTHFSRMFCDVHSGVHTHADIARLSKQAALLCVGVFQCCVCCCDEGAFLRMFRECLNHLTTLVVGPPRK